MAAVVVLALSGCAGDVKTREPSATPEGRKVLAVYHDGTSEAVTLAVDAGLIVGFVQTEQKAPLSDVVVRLRGSGIVSSVEGRFLFEGLRPAEYVLHAELEGYRTADAKIKVAAGQTVRVRVTMISLDAESSDAMANGGSSAKAASASPAFVLRIAAIDVPASVAWAGPSLAIWGVVAIAAWRRHNSPLSLVARGRKALACGEFTVAESLARRALSRRAGFADAWFLLGTSLVKRGAYGEATRQLGRAAAYYDPQMAGVAFLMTMAYRRMGKLDDARRWLPLVARDESYWNALETDPDGALRTWLGKGEVGKAVDPAYG